MDLVLEELCANSTCPIAPSENEELANTVAFLCEGDCLYKKALQLQELGDSLKGKHLRIATLQNYPLSYAIQENGRWVGKGVAFEFVKYMQDKYDFDYSVVVPKEDELGTNTSGIFGMLSTKQADIAAAFLPVIPKYWNLVKYSPSLDEGEWVVLMKRPSESATGSGLLAPFTWDVWVLIMVSLILIGPVIAFLIRLHRHLCKDQPSTSANLYACVWFVYGALLKQGTTVTPYIDSTRLAFATWWIFITILTAFYTANLTAFLTLSQFTLPVKSAVDIGSKRYNWVTRRGNAVEEAATNTEDELFGFLKGSKGYYTEETNENILQDFVKGKKYLYIGEKPIVEHMMYADYLYKTRSGIPESERCTFVIAEWAVLLRPRAFAYTKDFKYQDIFDNSLGHLVEGGIIKYQLREGLPKNTICPLNLGSKERQLRNADLVLTYYIVGAGFGSSVLSFFLEILLMFLINHCCPKKNKKKSASDPPNFPISPPSYHTLFGAPFNYENGDKKNINGRDYWVVPSERGNQKIVPIHAPSALLFQYTN